MHLAKPSSLRHWQISSWNGQAPSSPSSGTSRTLDDVLRRVTHEDISWGGPAIHLTSRRPKMYVIQIHFVASNNVAEYEALVNGLRITIELGVRRLDV